MKSRTKWIVSICLFSFVLFGEKASDAHYRPEQYTEAEKGIASILADLSNRLNTLETMAGQVETHAAEGDALSRCRARAFVAILRHQAMRAWYNRLLFQNLSDEAVSLGQMSTIVRLSEKALTNGIYQIGQIEKEDDRAAQRQTYARATETMRAILALYDEALRYLQSAIRTQE